MEQTNNVRPIPATDRLIRISTAGSRKATLWRSEELRWSEFAQRLQTPVRGAETLTEYLRLPKGKQDELKDVGGFVGGILKDGRRKPGSVVGRDLITLDFDGIMDGADAIISAVYALNCAAAIYSTRKHSPEKPRLRVVIPTDRSMTADEYEPCARRIAERIGMRAADPTTFQVSRLMYWPSCCAGAEYITETIDGALLRVDELLASYSDWRDARTWPQVPGVQAKQQELAARQEDPTTKTGTVGAFCRTYDIYSAIETFLPDIYVPVEGMADRYSYFLGSTAAGAIVYNHGMFLYSHHATDPAGGQLCNAFDLVRMHKFGAQDDDAKPGTPTAKLPSYRAMTDLVNAGEAGKRLRQERYETALEALTDAGNAEPTENTDWLEELEITPAGGYATTIENALRILMNDPSLKGRLRYDLREGILIAAPPLPWNASDPSEKPRAWTDADDVGVRLYLERIYRYRGARERIADAVESAARANAFDGVRDYLDGLIWDGIPRLDALLIDYMGAADTPYTRAVTAKAFVAAAARSYEPGIKFDNVLILQGPQGVGKSTLLRIMGGDWFLDSLTDCSGKDACELLRGKWIVELAELDSLNRSEMSTVKQFLSRQDDTYRAAYGHRVEKHLRRCVFFGSTNEGSFLRDSTGNRRFWPVRVHETAPKRSVFDDLRGERDQVWAEAVHRCRSGEALYLDAALTAAAEEQQEAHMIGDDRAGIIEEFLRRRLPQDWDKKDIAERRAWWALKTDGELERDRVCAMEIWVECLGGEIKNYRKTDAREINAMLQKISYLEPIDGPRQYACYGNQRGFRVATKPADSRMWRM